MKDKIQPGSQFLFCLIRTLDLIFGVTGLALIGLTIWMWREFNEFTIIQIVFLALGLFEIILVLLVWTAKTSTKKLRCFLFFMLILFAAEVTCVVVVFVTGPDIINDLAKDSKKQIDELKKYLDIVNYFVIGCMAVMFLLMSAVYCYIGSLRNRNNQYDYKAMDEDGNKMTIEEKRALDKDRVHEKYDRKREEMKDKYANYRKMKDNS